VLEAAAGPEPGGQGGLIEAPWTRARQLALCVSFTKRCKFFSQCVAQACQEYYESLPSFTKPKEAPQKRAYEKKPAKDDSSLTDELGMLPATAGGVSACDSAARAA
jgi:hypothetical protein